MHPHSFLFDDEKFEFETTCADDEPAGRSAAWAVDRMDRIDVHVAAVDGHAVVAVAGEIDPVTAAVFWRGIESGLDQSDRLVIDLRDTSFIDSSGIKVLIRAFKRVGQVPEALVVQPSAVAQRVLAVAGLDTIFGIATVR